MFNFKTILVDGKEHLLNRENTILLFRKMWTEFATNPEYKDYEFPKESEAILCKSFLRNQAKEKWLLEHTNLKSDNHSSLDNKDSRSSILNDCFLCEYDDIVGIEKKLDPCEACPINWGNEVLGVKCYEPKRLWLTLSFKEIAELPEVPINPKYESEN